MNISLVGFRYIAGFAYCFKCPFYVTSCQFSMYTRSVFMSLVYFYTLNISRIFKTQSSLVVICYISKVVLFSEMLCFFCLTDVLLLYMFVALPHGAVGWSAVSDCGIS